eukprot:scaffold2405_cov113-Isochrysis_galbana.AAC.6
MYNGQHMCTMWRLRPTSGGAQPRIMLIVRQRSGNNSFFGGLCVAYRKRSPLTLSHSTHCADSSAHRSERGTG